MRRKLVAGNWKMNGLRAAGAELESLVAANPVPLSADVLICPPATLLAAFATQAAASPISIGGQDCHHAVSGAHTGDISAVMLADAGATAVIIGHSERRADHAEDDAVVCAKAQAAWGADLTAIICVGETEAERDAGQALEIVRTQLRGSVPDGATALNTVIAYEPVWAIGTGRTPSNNEIAEVHAEMRSALVSRFAAEGAEMLLLYGGSVKPANAEEIFAIENVDGGLVGGASLKAADFNQIIAAAR